MSRNDHHRIADILERHEPGLLADWVKAQSGLAARSGVRITDTELRGQAAEFLRLLVEAARTGDLNDITAPAWARVRGALTEVSESRGRQGFSPTETALFIFSLKEPLFVRLRHELGADASALADAAWATTVLLDQLGLFTTEVYQRSREAVIARQQQEMLELSTPVVRLWQGVLALPLIGTLDSARAQVIMESLLEKIVETGATIAIIDITGVPTVDTLVAQHLLKTVAATRLMGADCIVSGVRPQIAQTIVHLGVNLSDVVTKSSLAEAFALALRRTGLTVTPIQARS